MKERWISAVELAEKIGLNYGTLNIHLSNFMGYAKKGGTHFLYKYDKKFLKELQIFYKKKMQSKNARYAMKYYKVVYGIEQLLQKEKLS